MNRVKKDFTDKGLGLKEAMEAVKGLEKCVLINELICIEREEAARRKLEAEEKDDDDDDDEDTDEDNDEGKNNNNSNNKLLLTTTTVGDQLLPEDHEHENRTKEESANQNQCLANTDQCIRPALCQCACDACHPGHGL